MVGRLAVALLDQHHVPYPPVFLNAQLAVDGLGFQRAHRQQGVRALVRRGCGSSPKQVHSMWAAAGFKDTLLRWKMKPEVVYGNEKAIQPRVQA